MPHTLTHKRTAGEAAKAFGKTAEGRAIEAVRALYDERPRLVHFAVEESQGTIFRGVEGGKIMIEVTDPNIARAMSAMKWANGHVMLVLSPEEAIQRIEQLEVRRRFNQFPVFADITRRGLAVFDFENGTDYSAAMPVAGRPSVPKVFL